MTLAAFIDDARNRFAPSYSVGLTNHLPMCLAALHRLGAGDDRLQKFVDAYAPQLEPASPWPRAQGLMRDVRARGSDTVLREQLRALLPGLAGGALHGAIRLAYATTTRDIDDIAFALAYFSETGLGIDVPSGGVITEIGALAQRLRAQHIEKTEGGTITDRIRVVATDKRFIDVVKDVAVDKTTLSQVSGLGARWYLAADDFASLHALTGAHAVRILRPWIDDERAADRALAIAALALFVVCGSPPRPDARGLPRADDRELKSRALGSDDDHLAKLIVTALDEEKAEEDAIYRIVATRAARRGRA